MAEDTSPLASLKTRPALDPRTSVEVAAAEAPVNPSVFLAAGRHPQESLGPVGGWKCPGCLAEQTGRFEQGCQACGAGRPGQYVGEAPPLRREDLEAPGAGEGVEEAGGVRRAAPVVRMGTETPIAEAQAAFDRWWETKAIAAPGWRIAFRECWLTAWQAADAYHTVAEVPPMLDTQRTDGVGMNRSGVIARTLAAALDHFIDTILREAETEIADGTWLSVEAAQALSQRYKDNLE